MQTELNAESISLQTTGDPFVDLGNLVLESLRERFPEKQTKDLLEFVMDVYMKNWNQKLHSIFHTNAPLLHPSGQGKHRQNTIQYYNSVFSESEAEGTITGFCRTCGNEGRLFPNIRNFYPVSGALAFVNFHHGHEDGIFLCRDCTFKLFFIPLGVQQMGGMVGMLHAQSPATRNFWKRKIIEVNLDKLSHGTSEGILKASVKNPQNALFDLARQIILEFLNSEESEYLQLITFSNFGATPGSEIHVLPNPIFNFLSRVLKDAYRRSWFTFVRRYYRISKAKWDAEKKIWIREEKKEATELTDNDYPDNPNYIYQQLLSNNSILKQLLTAQKSHYLNNEEKFPIAITLHYVTEVLNMEKEQVKLIKRIADVIYELSEKEQNFKKYLVLLESVGKAYQLRGVLLKIIKANYVNGAKEPLIRMEDYVTYLFPDGQYWGEVRDLLLIHLYEKLHDHKIQPTEIPQTEIQETEMTPTESF
jgi:CRISPR-associated protein Cst1